MDLEHLNKSQVILLTLFVSFVTSIATGIVTVSLMNQAPPQVASTVNRIIERTVEQVAVPTQAATPATIKTVVVKDDDLAAQSITAVQKSLIRIVASSSPELLVARGIIIDSNGVAISDRGSFDSSLEYGAILSDGTLVPVTLRPTSTSTPIAILDLHTASSTKLIAAALADPSKLQLGQSVIRIGGSGADTVGVGAIARLPQNAGKHSREVEATVMSTTPGSVLITLFGDLIGIITATSAEDGADFYTIPDLQKSD